MDEGNLLKDVCNCHNCQFYPLKRIPHLKFLGASAYAAFSLDVLTDPSDWQRDDGRQAVVKSCPSLAATLQYSNIATGNPQSIR